MKEVTWTTKTGEKMKISDMTDSHLENAKNLLSKQVNEAESAMAMIGEGIGSFMMAMTIEDVARKENWIKEIEREQAKRTLNPQPITNL